MSKKIILTGTSRGIGLELAQQLAQQGHQVLALSRKDDSVNALNLDGISSFSFDITQSVDLQKVEAFVEDNWGEVDVLIHNAGALVNKPFADLSVTDFQTVYDVNVFGVASLTQIILPFMKAGAHVVTVSSMGGIQGSMKFPGLAAYSSSKGAVITLSELLAEEYKEHQIAFNVLALGAVQTEMLEEAFPGYQAPISAEGMAAYIADFALTGNKFYNGKVLQVSASTP
ncbi:SDR family NAD(P)-dependent oxidoreductase [Leeuwenhoekiella marinoflava]|uniref:Short-subunit dehydrogenase n=2 Tax=Leeuwenhoekiella marinoflava TaxID=988 RepID=A0A4Q0PJT8_9FLAO|nr:SDR family oxidoreductase [Leeuwenhoekiella marinoflava]RXG27938.1 short-subunit dehydrogenase [Leeuwenhoekiella marinoflava]SHF60824.1 Short-chain dehydrogenase [Leeuwenhoekiella marinoflava DSM 3653]